MRNAWLAAALASAVCTMCATQGSAANLVSDGSFTTPTFHPGANTFFSGETFGPWSVIGTGCGHVGCAGIDVVSNDFEAPPGGGNVVDLSGLAPGGITQTLALTAGDTYDLSFYLSGNPDGSPANKKMTVSIGSLDQTLHYTLKPSNSAANMNYVLESFTFTANSNDLLSFASEGPRNSPYGAVIGDVSVIPVSPIPEPAMWALWLAGFGALGFILRARRKQSNALEAA